MTIRKIKFRRIFIGVLCLSMTGGVVGYLMSEKRNKKREQAVIIKVKEFRTEYRNSPSIIAIRNLSDTTEYKRIVKSDGTTTNISFVILKPGEHVLVIDGSDMHFKKIGLQHPNALTRQDVYSEFWIWYEFLE